MVFGGLRGFGLVLSRAQLMLVLSGAAVLVGVLGVPVALARTPVVRARSFAADPAIALSPISGTPTSTVEVSGGGFGESEKVDISFGSTEVATPTTSGFGNFSAAFQVPASATPGTHRVTAVGRISDLQAHADFTVSRWAIQNTPNPADSAGSELHGVSCTSASVCTAVGHYFNGTAVGTLAERWNGTKWVVKPTPHPAGAIGSFLAGVSCTSASACTAVGYHVDSGERVMTLAERWDGTKWVIEPTPNPAGSHASFLAAVSCTSASACTAVGYHLTSAGTALTLAERWDGTKWVIEPTPNPAGSTYNVLNGVSCTSASACTAVGDRRDSAGTALTLAERWNGTKWVIRPTPDPAGATGSFLSGVSCTSASACTAVGDHTNSEFVPATLAERWDGTKWVIEPTAPGTFAGELDGVSCASASACTAVGRYFNDIDVVTLAESWDGTKWVIEPTPNPAGGMDNVLRGVSCTSASVCTAVGHYTSAGTTVTLAEHHS